MTKTIPEAVGTCFTYAITIDFPTRMWVARYRGLNPLYIGASFVGRFIPCVASAITAYCDDDALECKMVQGASIYAARAYTSDQHVIGRMFAGAANRIAIHKTSPLTTITIKALESLSIAAIFTGGNLKEALALGGAIGVSEALLEVAVAQPIVEYATTILQSVPEAELLGETAHEEL